MSRHHADVIVAGLGPTGLATAIAVSRLGLRTLAVGRRPALEADTRAMALMAPSVTFLENIGVWEACADRAESLAAIRIVDATGRLIRAPETTFTATDAGMDRFGACITTADLVSALQASAASAPGLTIVETAGIAHIEPRSASIEVATSEGATLHATLLAGADGRESPARKAAGIPVTAWSYPQTAIALTFGHARPHDGASIEFHRPNGPLTTVPLRSDGARHRSSLVWVESHARARELMGLDDETFARTLRRELHGILGSIGPVSRRASFPLAHMRARPMARSRIALVGEAAHVIPPIGAQGLNLALRDVAALVGVLGGAMHTTGGATADLGAAAVLEAYDRSRHGDVWSRLAAVDLLNKSLLSSQLPIQALRGVGLHILQNAPSLRDALIRQGVAAAGELPELMHSRTRLPSPTRV